MLSRVADSIYWMSRYIERAENVARVVNVNFLLQLDVPGPYEQWDPIVQATGDEEDFGQRYETASRAHVIQFLTFDQQNPNSIISCISRARENARTVREIISSEMWEELNEFYLQLRAADAPDRALQAAPDFFRQIRRTSHLIEGTKNETMPHGEAWHFSRLARHIERADKTSRLLDVKYFLLQDSVMDVGKPVDDLQWGALLRSASAFEAYRKTYGSVTTSEVVSFLLLDDEFPRSIRHCVDAAQESLHAITGTPARRFANVAERSLGRLVSDLDYTDADEVILGGLHQFLDELQQRLNDVGDDITKTFFALGPLA